MNSMLRHICGHIYDIIRHIVVSCCQALRCAARSAFSAVGQLIEELEKLNVPAPGECVNHPTVTSNLSPRIMSYHIEELPQVSMIIKSSMGINQTFPRGRNPASSHLLHEARY